MSIIEVKNLTKRFNEFTLLIISSLMLKKEKRKFLWSRWIAC